MLFQHRHRRSVHFKTLRQALLFKENTSSNNTNNQESLDKEGELSASIKTLSRYIKNI
jgi:hypothetical protein